MAAGKKIEPRPIGDKILVKRDVAEERSEGGLYMPDTSKTAPARGTVIAIGRGTIQDGIIIPLETKVGDRVLFTMYSGTNIEIEKQEFVVLREQDILVVF